MGADSSDFIRSFLWGVVVGMVASNRKVLKSKVNPCSGPLYSINVITKNMSSHLIGQLSRTRVRFTTFLPMFFISSRGITCVIEAIISSVTVVT